MNKTINAVDCRTSRFFLERFCTLKNDGFQLNRCVHRHEAGVILKMDNEGSQQRMVPHIHLGVACGDQLVAVHMAAPPELIGDIDDNSLEADS